jgi:hypothetical protein
VAQPLTRRELDVLAFEQHWFRAPGAKGTAIDQLFPGWSETRYYQVLNGLIDRPEAAAHAPDVVRRLRAIRESRRSKITHRRV